MANFVQAHRYPCEFARRQGFRIFMAVSMREVQHSERHSGRGAVGKNFVQADRDLAVGLVACQLKHRDRRAEEFETALKQLGLKIQ